MPTSVPRWSDPDAFAPDATDELPPEIAAELPLRTASAGPGEVPDLDTLLEVAVSSVGGTP
ncbi:hypothetical protein IQ251_16560, partial [Saccharopolyspora sp. HNM0983]|nr:hypothetical protein [Saccharopolyspora sp. HNM0983]